MLFAYPTPRRGSRRLIPHAALCLAGMLMLAACGSGGSARTSAAQESTAGYPVVLDNCGTRVEVKAAPKRAVSLDQGSTEIMLALGLGDRMAGTGTWTDPVLTSSPS